MDQKIRLVKNGKIYLDGTLREYEKEKLAFEKLEKIEDIEEELGIDLETFIKIFKAHCGGQTVFVKRDSDGDYERTIYKVWLSNEYNGVLLKTIKGGALLSDYKLKDYGKTWALTKEELL